MKTNAIRLLEQAGIEHQIIEYEVDEADLSASHVAEQLGEPIEAVYKTIVLRGDKTGVFVCIVQGDKEVDLKKAAKASGNKSCAPIRMQELLPLTGYIRGGCSPIGMKKQYPMYIDEWCQLLDYIYISAGARGMQVKLLPQDLIDYAGLQVAELV